MARNKAGLEETKANINAIAPGVSVHLVQVDLEDLDSLERVFSEAAKFADDTKHQQYILVHNAGSVGDVTKPMIQLSDPNPIQHYLAVNFTSVFVLTAHFLSHFTSGHRMVINITSILASVYLPSFSMYSTSRAARRALMGVLAVENPEVRILNYSPGPCDTDMHRGIIQQTFSDDFREKYGSQVALTCQQSISKLIGVLQEDKFENGSVVDYFDV